MQRFGQRSDHCQQLNFNLATRPMVPASLGSATVSGGAPEGFSDGTNTLVVERVDLVLREVELRNKGAANENLVKDNIRSALDAFEDHNCNGVDDHGGDDNGGDRGANGQHGGLDDGPNHT